ncbi:MAG: DUF4834 family protein [Flavobacteriales bacterium]|nr:DUF4834 family protein [Flavobacteriales bacterium]
MEVITFETTSLLRTLLIIVLVYYGFRFVMRRMKPYIIKKGMEEIHRRQQQGFQGGYAREESRSYDKSGKVTVEQPRSHSKTGKDPDGEYVDFEEIKD